MRLVVLCPAHTFTAADFEDAMDAWSGPGPDLGTVRYLVAWWCRVSAWVVA